LAQSYFEFSLEKEPNYALAHAGLASVWVARLLFGPASREEASPMAHAAAQRALALDGNLAEVHHTLAVLKGWVQWDWAGAESSFRRAIELDPNCPDARVYYARLLGILRRPAEAIAQIERALEIDPHNALFRTHYAHLLNAVGRYDQAITEARRAIAAEPDQQQAQNALRNAFRHKGMLKEALGVALQRTRKTAKGNPEVRQVVQRVYDQGRYQEAARLWASLGEERWRKGLIAPGLGVFFTLSNQPDKLLEWWERTLQQRDPSMPEAVREGGRAFPQLEANPRYQALLQRMGLR
jgi:serine/threonine-protein kinase